MDQHPVPQNVTTFQFRLIGDMTIKQFGYLAGGCIVGYISLKLPVPFFFTYPLAATSVLLGIGLAFVPIEERPMDVWIVSFLRSIYSPTQYLWQKSAPTVEPSMPSTPTATDVPPAQTVQPAVSHTEQAPHVAPRAIPVQATQQPAPPPVVPTPPTPVVDTPPSVQTPIPTQHSTTHESHTSFVTTLLQSISSVFKKTPSTTTHTPETKPHTQDQTFRPVMPQEHTAAHVVTSHTSNPLEALGGLFHTQTQSSTPAQASTTQPSITGQRLDLTPQETHSQPTSKPEDEQKLQEAQQKEATLEKEVQQLTDQLHSQQLTDGRILELQKQLTEVLSDRNRLEQELITMKHKATSQPEHPAQATRQATMATVEEPSQPTIKIMSPDVAVKAGLPRLTSFPNVVTGIIKDDQGNLLSGILVTVRDKDDVPVRALKTNKLGQFAASTPLTSGVYTVDIEDPRAQFLFDRIRITLDGSIMSAIEVIAKSPKQMQREKLAEQVFGKT